MRVVIVALLVIPALVMLCGCASGVRMSDDERIACRDSGCSVMTDTELRTLVDLAAGQGYRKGWADATRQAGRGI